MKNSRYVILILGIVAAVATPDRYTSPLFVGGMVLFFLSIIVKVLAVR